jgi:hypothetical protein
LRAKIRGETSQIGHGVKGGFMTSHTAVGLPTTSKKVKTEAIRIAITSGTHGVCFRERDMQFEMENRSELHG